MSRALVPHWYPEEPPRAVDAEVSRVVAYLRRTLGKLQRTLGVLHDAVEHRVVELPDRVAATSTTAITTTTNTDITGATVTFTPAVDMRILVTAVFMYGCSAFASVAHFFTGSLHVNGVEQTGSVQGSATAASFRNTICGSWVVALTSGTEYTIKLRAKTGDVTTTFNAIASGNTAFTIAKVPNTYLVP